MPSSAAARPTKIASLRQRFVACALIAAGIPATTQAGCTVAMMELPVRMVGHRAIATISINGTKVPMVLDSGAFFSMLSEGTAAQLKLPLKSVPPGFGIQGIAGKVDQVQMTRVDKLQLLDGTLRDIDFFVGGNELDAGGMGLLGRNLLATTDIEYDLAHGAVRLVWPREGCDKANMAYWAADTPVSEVELLHEYHSNTPAIRTWLELNGHRTLALFDTGATTLVSLRTAHHAGVKDEDMTPIGQIAGVGRRTAGAWIANFDRVELGGESVLHNRLAVGDYDMMDNDMLVGIDFFLSHRIYISKKRWVMFFTYNGGPVFALNQSEKLAPPASAPDAADTLTADEHARRGAAWLARGDVDAALADLDRACTLEPDNAAVHIARAAVHFRMRHGHEALADLDVALRLDPALADARRDRAWAREADHQKGLALEDLSALDQTLPPQSQIRLDMGRLYDRLDLPAQALPQWTLWIAAHPHDIRLENAWNARCWDRVRLNIDLDKARDDCNAAVDADSKNPTYRESRGWVYLRMGKTSEAVEDFDRALELNPYQASSLYGRGLAHLGRGEAAPAQSDFAAARAARPDIDAHAKTLGLPVAPGTPASLAN